MSPFGWLPSKRSACSRLCRVHVREKADDGTALTDDSLLLVSRWLVARTYLSDGGGGQAY